MAYSYRVQQIIGISERDLVKLSDQNRKRYIDYDSNEFINSEDDSWISYGNFNMPSIEELKREVKTKLGFDPVLGLGKLSESKRSKIKINNVQISVLDGIDIATIISTPPERKDKSKRMFQVASNFNCLEKSQVFALHLRVDT